LLIVGWLDLKLVELDGLLAIDCEIYITGESHMA